ncbi:uncharacterized protein [Nicotiana sylvestris]|uniref:uncharacterized protein n=1 Tax=Nicotiana sylvestris TaxID=4096 RepID=UPI00388C572F
MGQFVRIKTSDLIPAERMPFPEEWNMKRLRDVVAMSPPPLGEEEIPKPTNEKKRKRGSPASSPKPKKSKARKPKADSAALSSEAAQHIRDEDEEGKDKDCLPCSFTDKHFPNLNLSPCEAELKKLVEERDGLKSLYVQKEDEVRDLRVELAKARQEQTELIEKAQQKGELVEQLREELKMKEVESLGQQSRRETLEEVHTRGFDLSADIEKAKTLEEEVVALISNDEDSASGSESGGDGDEFPVEEILEDAAPNDSALEDVASKYVVPGDVVPK